MVPTGTVVVAAVLAASLAGCGTSSTRRAAGQAPASRIVDVSMRDTAYDPTSVSVTAGEKVTFVFHNTGTVVHDAFLGSEGAQAEHEREMREPMGAMDGMHHDDPSATSVAPGQTATLTHTFTKTEKTIIGCHEPGHYEAGMRLMVTVR
jgi:uncharacterized cupredoxin-like copper-binding protein